MTPQVITEIRGRTAWIVFNRPEVRNAISDEMWRTMSAFLRDVRAQGQTRAVVITGEGDNFSSGGDLKPTADILQAAPAERANYVVAAARAAQEFFRVMDIIPQPVIASVRGYALGGAFGIVAAADLVIASTTAMFSVPQIRLGHATDHGESWHLPRKVGSGRALQILLLGERMDATEALACGLVNWVVPNDQLDSRALEVAAQFDAGANVAAAAVKNLVRSSERHTFEQQLVCEREELAILAATDDFAEGIRSFVEKRKPQFLGR